MASRSECDELERMERDGREREAFMMAMALITRDGGDESGRAFAVIERAAEQHADAALSAAMSFRIFGRKETRPGCIATFFEMALTSDDENVRRMAAFGFGRHLLDTGQTGRGVRLMKISRRLGDADAAAELGRMYEHGSHGLKADPEKAVECYVEAVEGDSALGMYLLSQFMVSNKVMVADYHPLDLMQEAAALGYPEALAIVEHMAAEGDLPEATPEKDLLPYVVVPDGCERIQQVRAALVNEFSVDEEEAGSVTAALHGYPDWNTMTTDAVSPDKSKGKFDEDCTASEFNEREAIQTEIFEKRTGSSRFGGRPLKMLPSLTAVRLLRPTSRTAKPSLRRFDRIMEGSIFKGLPPNLDELVRESLEKMGLSELGRSQDELRKVWPLKVSKWLNTFERHGWPMRRRRLDATADGEQVAVCETADGRLFKVFMSVVSFDPGDLGDEHVEELGNRIAATSSRAVLIFNHPRVSRIQGSETRGAFYGGRILNNGRWADFFLRPSGGIEDALRQHEEGVDIQSPKAVGEHAFEGAISLAYGIAAEVTGQPGTDGFGLFHSTSNWSSPMPPAAMAAARLMREIGSLLQ